MKKKQKTNGNGSSKQAQGRPRVLPKELSSRFQIRCAPDDIEAWEARAQAMGYGGASAWIRKVLADALKQPVR